MGYTHYWRQKRDFTTAEWSRIKKYAELAIKVAGSEIKLADARGDSGKPIINETHIAFNGLGAEAHETFWLERKRRDRKDYEGEAEFEKEGAFDFCKTQNKPYDVVVVSILWAAREVAPDAITLSSDGGDEVFKDEFGIGVPSAPAKAKKVTSHYEQAVLSYSDSELIRQITLNSLYALTAVSPAFRKEYRDRRDICAKELVKRTGTKHSHELYIDKFFQEEATK